MSSNSRSLKLTFSKKFLHQYYVCIPVTCPAHRGLQDCTILTTGPNIMKMLVTYWSSTLPSALRPMSPFQIFEIYVPSSKKESMFHKHKHTHTQLNWQHYGFVLSLSSTFYVQTEWNFRNERQQAFPEIVLISSLSSFLFVSDTYDFGSIHIWFITSSYIMTLFLVWVSCHVHIFHFMYAYFYTNIFSTL
jgi:hypothetical protein